MFLIESLHHTKWNGKEIIAEESFPSACRRPWMLQKVSMEKQT